MRKISNYYNVRKLLTKAGVPVTQPVFHSTRFQNFKKIIKSGIAARAGGEDNDAYYDNAVCFSRNLDFLTNVDFFGNGEIILILDSAQLRNKFKSYPFNYYPGIRGTHDENTPYEFEERFSTSPPYRGSGKDESLFCLIQTVIKPSFIRAIIVKESIWDRNYQYFLDIGKTVIIRAGNDFRLPEPGIDYDNLDLASISTDNYSYRDIKNLYTKEDLSPDEVNVLKYDYLKEGADLNYIAKRASNKEIVNYIFDDFSSNSKFFSYSTGSKYDGLSSSEVREIVLTFLDKDILNTENLEKIFFRYILKDPDEVDSFTLFNYLFTNSNLPLNLIEKAEDYFPDTVEYFNNLSDTLDGLKSSKIRDYILDYYLIAAQAEPKLLKDTLSSYKDYLNLKEYGKVLDIFLENRDSAKGFNFTYFINNVNPKYNTYFINKLALLAIRVDKSIYRYIYQLYKANKKPNIKRPFLVAMLRDLLDTPLAYTHEEKLVNIIKKLLEKSNRNL